MCNFAIENMRRMSPVDNTPLQKNAMNHHGVEEVLFCTFSSKNATYRNYRNDYTQSISKNLSRFSFTGKEKDEKTGYGYFGARYMDHELMTMWLSVDPMADKYPSISPYNYCMWNPVRLVDPNGQDTFNINIATGHVDYRYDVNRGKDVVSVYKNNIHVLTLPCSGRVEYLGPSGATIYDGKKYYTHGLKFHNEKDGHQIFIGIWMYKGSDVEWDYYKETNKNGVTDGLLITSSVYDRVFVPQSFFSGVVSEWHHLHPYNSTLCTSNNNQPFIPSWEDVKKAMSFNFESISVRCILYFNGGNYEFSDWDRKKYHKYTNQHNNFFKQQKDKFRP